jgi:hypothetical protein
MKKEIKSHREILSRWLFIYEPYPLRQKPMELALSICAQRQAASLKFHSFNGGGNPELRS